MRFLLTNDDGIDAEGLAALAVAAEPLGTVTVIAPARNWSVCGHRVTTDQPLRTVASSEGRWAVEGTPADCVRLAYTHLAPDFTWVLAGLNHGGNVGADVYHSGTVAAVREGALLGRPGVAFSHYRKRGLEIDWPRASRWMRRTLEDLLGRPCARGSFWNVNLPHLRPDEPDPKIVFCPLDPNPLPVAFRCEGDLYHYEGNYHARSRDEGCDVAVCFGGDIAVSLLEL